MERREWYREITGGRQRRSRTIPPVWQSFNCISIIFSKALLKISQENEKRAIMTRKNDAQIREEFRQRRSSQLLSIAVSLLLIVLLTIIFKHPDFFGEIAKDAIFGLQLIVIAAFIGFTAVNWRCPLCRKYLGGNINRPACGKCGARLR